MDLQTGSANREHLPHRTGPAVAATAEGRESPIANQNESQPLGRSWDFPAGSSERGRRRGDSRPEQTGRTSRAPTLVEGLEELWIARALSDCWRHPREYSEIPAAWVVREQEMELLLKCCLCIVPIGIFFLHQELLLNTVPQ
ncbi:unnamed protein product [Natator depressus]